MIRTGDKVRKRISTSTTAGIGCGVSVLESQSYTGTVILVHQQGRFYTVRFDFPAGRILESYREA